jgi:hypothetical protein
MATPAAAETLATDPAATMTATTSAPERRAAAVRLVRDGKLDESLPLWLEELRSGEDGASWVRAAAVEAMAWRDLSVAGALARLYAAARWGSRWYPGETPSAAPGATPGATPNAPGASANTPTGATTSAPAAPALPIPAHPPRTQLSLPKLRHDIDQFRYLRNRGRLGAEFDAFIAAYGDIADRLFPAGIDARFPLEGGDLARIGEAYNRIVHLAPAPRVERALSPAWDPVTVEDRYLAGPPGLVVIDDFLSQPALDEVRRYCLESTVWSGTRYTEGRLGAFFIDGFHAPLLLQIAEEVRAAFPRVIGDRHPLRQLWGFKYAPSSAGRDGLHADFAAVNVNFWITPATANLDPASGGLIVHNVTAPLSWDFHAYNERPDLIARYLRSRDARPVRIPYRENRAIVFNSDLFHATEPIRFRPEYEHRRVNITMLYGDRADDRHHPSPSASAATGHAAAWRSAALSRVRRH